MGYQIYRVGDRWGGYGVPTYCEHPDCNEEIDRGMSFACGEEPFSEFGCDRYFCSKHRENVGFKQDGSGGLCNHVRDCKCEFKEVCFSCSGRDKQYPYGYPKKPEHPKWVTHILKDKSWKDWRKENPDEEKKLKKQLNENQGTEDTR